MPKDALKLSDQLTVTRPPTTAAAVSAPVVVPRLVPDAGEYAARRRCQVGPFWSGHASLPRMTTASNDPYRGFRFPAEIIQHAGWLYHPSA